jgi:hypothetical protein
LVPFGSIPGCRKGIIVSKTSGNVNGKESETRRSEHLTLIVFGLGGLAAIVLITVVLHLLLPKEYRACSLMPGFCAPKAERPRGGDFEEIGKLRPGASKFDLNHALPSRY